MYVILSISIGIFSVLVDNLVLLHLAVFVYYLPCVILQQVSCTEFFQQCLSSNIVHVVILCADYIFVTFWQSLLNKTHHYQINK